MTEKNITLAIGATELEFKVGTNDYDRFVNEFKPDDKVAPAKRLLRRTLLDAEKREVLDELCDQGLAVELAGKLVEEFRPAVEIEVKKSSSGSKG